MAVKVAIHLDKVVRAANRRLLGFNIEWFNGGDGMTDNGVPRAAMYARLAEIDWSQGRIRYPGGSAADNFDWTQGEGPLGSRGPNTIIQGQTFTTYFGTGECLALADRFGLTPLFQTDIHGGNARVTSWMAAYPQIREWSIGNEPYLQLGDPSFWMDPAAYLAVANSQINAMLTANPNLEISVPSGTDIMGAVAANHYPGYNAIVFAGLDPRIRLFDLHVYVPMSLAAETLPEAWNRGMAGYRSVLDYLQDNKDDLAAAGIVDYDFVVSEYGVLYQADPNQRLSVYSAIIQSETMRVLALEPKVHTGLKWSVSSNAGFGFIIAPDGTRRPYFHVLKAWDRLLHGNIVHTDVAGYALQSNLENARVLAYTDTPSVSAIASHEPNYARAIIINKKYTETETIQVELPAGGPDVFARPPRVLCLQAAPGLTPFSGLDTEAAYTYTDLRYSITGPRSLSFVAPAASLIFVEMDIVSSPYLSDFGRYSGRLRPELFPSWVVKPEGRPLLTEADFPAGDIGTKFETSVAGGGAGGSVAANAVHYFGGAGSIALTTNSAIGASSRARLLLPFTADRGIVAFEMRFIPAAGHANNAIEFSIGSHTGDTIDARVRYDVGTDTWTYQDPTQNDVYLPFTPPVLISQPTTGGGGDFWGWVRLVVDFSQRKFIRFQAAGPTGNLFDSSMLNIPMRNRADAGGSNMLAFFVKAVAGSAANHVSYTTDWAISELFTY